MLLLLLLMIMMIMIAVVVVVGALDTRKWAVSHIFLNLFPVTRRLDGPQILLNQVMKRNLGTEFQPTSR
jgi:hypothetical protein